MPAARKELDELSARLKKLPAPVRVLYARPRTFVSIGIGTVCFFLLPDSLRLVTRLLIAWDIFTAFYVALAYAMMFRCDHSHIRRNAILQDDGRFLILPHAEVLGFWQRKTADVDRWLRGMRRLRAKVMGTA